MLKFEIAKNGQDTCLFNRDGNWIYVYSKYNPSNIQMKEVIESNSKYIFILGLGLGYEYFQIKSKCTNQKIIVIESNQQFIHYFQEKYPNEDITIWTENRFKAFKTHEKVQVIENYNLTTLNSPYYREVKQHIFPNQNGNFIMVFDNHTIAKDCALNFEKLGFNVLYEQWLPLDVLRNHIYKVNPLFIFSLNYSLNLAQICEELKITYISWTVDTPAYSLFEEKCKNYEYSYKFVYDEYDANNLKELGVHNVFYLPVAANVERYNHIQLSEDEYKKYKTDISFLGTNCADNEYFLELKYNISENLRDEIEKVIDLQCFNDEEILKEYIAKTNLVERFENELGISMENKRYGLMNKKIKLFYLLGRYHSLVERNLMINKLARKYNIALFGPTTWKNSLENLDVYQGYIENFVEMPKVFKASKININNIRTFVESGLPQRVFDILACKAFLVTNSKKDIHRYFEDGKDLVVYRDFKDLEEIIEYYLIHEDERNRIAERGFTTVKNHSIEIRLKEMISVVNKYMKNKIIYVN